MLTCKPIKTKQKNSALTRLGDACVMFDFKIKLKTVSQSIAVYGSI